MQSSIFFAGGANRSQTWEPLPPIPLSPALWRLFYSSSRKGTRGTGCRSSPPAPRALSPWLLQNPGTGDLLRDLPYLAPGLSSFQGALSTSETEHVLLPHGVPKQWRNSVCQSSQDENESQTAHSLHCHSDLTSFPTRQN